jgi:hypothetical protein
VRSKRSYDEEKNAGWKPALHGADGKSPFNPDAIRISGQAKAKEREILRPRRRASE